MAQNYPTHAISLWLSNEEHLYNHCRYLACEASSVDELAKNLEEWIQEDKEKIIGYGNMFADLLEWTIEQINFEEIAREYYEEYHEEEDE